MSVNKEYRCMVHGPFESADDPPLCPRGCDTVEREFRTPVGFVGDRTRSIDSTLEGLAKAHGLTDMRNRNGEPAASPKIAAANERARKMHQFIHEKYGDGWGDMAPGQTQNVKTGEVSGSGAGANAVVAAHGGQGGNTVAALKESGVIPEAMPVTKHIVKNTPDLSTVAPPSP